MAVLVEDWKKVARGLAHVSLVVLVAPGGLCCPVPPCASCGRCGQWPVLDIFEIFRISTECVCSAFHGLGPRPWGALYQVL